MPQTWFELASDARKAASRLVSENYRSCLSRAYYAAYSKVTFELAGMAGITFPAGDEGPKHPGRTGTGGIRRLIETHMTRLEDARRMKLSELVGRLYTLRIVADYRPSMDVDPRDAREAVSIMKILFSRVFDCFGRGDSDHAHNTTASHRHRQQGD
jgi:hypothetical protein